MHPSIVFFVNQCNVRPHPENTIMRPIHDHLARADRTLRLERLASRQKALDVVAMVRAARLLAGSGIE